MGGGAVRSGGARSLMRLAPLLVLLAGLGLFFAFGLQEQLSCAALRANRDGLQSWVGDHRLPAVLLFMGG